MVIIGFEDRVSFRLKEDERKKIIKVFKKNQDIFESPSHFLRVAVIKELRKYDKRGGRKNGFKRNSFY